jgi:hypothetical protein
VNKLSKRRQKAAVLNMAEKPDITLYAIAESILNRDATIAPA